MREAIACRVLHCQLGKKDEEVIVRFGIPKKEEDYYTCEYEITIAGSSEAYHCCGVDSVQAIQLAMFVARSTLNAIQGASNWTFNGEPSTGLPSKVSDWE